MWFLFWGASLLVGFGGGWVDVNMLVFVFGRIARLLASWEARLGCRVSRLGLRFWGGWEDDNLLCFLGCVVRLPASSLLPRFGGE